MKIDSVILSQNTQSCINMAKAQWWWALAKLTEIPLLLSFSLLGLVFVAGFGNVGAQADVTPPVVTVPSNMTVYGEDKSGTIVGFNVTAVDDVDGELTPVCNPASFFSFSNWQ